MSDGATGAPHTKDAFLGGRVTLLQPEKGHRAGLDAALLQAVVPTDASGLLVDLGAGVGTVAFSAAARARHLHAVALERDPDLAALGRQALSLPENADFAPRVRFVTADVASPNDARDDPGERSADWVLMNPPFDTPDRGRPSPNARRQAAHMGDQALLPAWCATAAMLLRPGGRLGLIHRPKALPAVLEALSGAFGGVRVLPTHPSANAPAGRVIVVAERASRSPFSLRAGLVLHGDGGGWTPEADAILRGEATLPI